MEQIKQTNIIENQITRKLISIRSLKKIGIMTHIVVGFPTLSDSKKIAVTMAEAGVDFIELQIPFSDPMADGATIMAANKISLENGTQVSDCFKLARELSIKPTLENKVPLLFMTYFNIVHNYGVEKFCEDARLAGISGLIIPDISLEEEANEHFLKSCAENNLLPIRLLAPASTDKRIKLNADIAKGFIYFSGRQGTTGIKSELDQNLVINIERIKKFTDTPLAVGFGISKPEHISALINHADVAVIGSAAIETYNKNKSMQELKVFIKSLVEAGK